MAQLYTLEEAARALGTTPEDLEARAQDGAVPAFRDRGSWWFRIVDIEEAARHRGSSVNTELRPSGLDISAASGSGEMVSEAALDHLIGLGGLDGTTPWVPRETPAPLTQHPERTTPWVPRQPTTPSSGDPERTTSWVPGQHPEPRALSSLDEMNLEKSILRRGLATTPEIEVCKSHRAKLAAKNEIKGLLEIMVEARVLTQNQSVRVLKEIVSDSNRKLEIPGYQIIEKLGKGSMGIVYKGRQIAVDRIVAVKILLDALAQNKEFIKRFDREAKIAAKLTHTNIVNAIDAGEVNGYHYFVMEYVEGRTIKDDLDKQKIYDEKDAVEIVMAVAEALKHAHQRGLIHRDVKPGNLLLTKEGGVKLADLGLARLTADEKWAMSEAGMAIGTPYYISPEQVRGQVDVDIRADIYSLGATLYHMVTGQVPYAGDTPVEVMRKHVDKNVSFTPPDHINTRLSPGLGMVVETMMKKNRENRYRNPDDLILDLKCLLQDEHPLIAAPMPGGLAKQDTTELEEEVSTQPKIEVARVIDHRNLLIAALAGLLALAVTDIVALLMTR